MKRLFLTSIYLVLFGLSVFAQKTVIVSTKKANIRETPSSTAKVVGTVVKGNKLQVSANHETWYYVKFGNLRGWIHFSTIKIDYSNEENLPDLSKMANKDPLDEYIDEFVKLRSINTNKWLHINEVENETYYINPSKVVRTGNVVEFWIKVQVDDKKQYWREKYKQWEISFDESVNYDKFSHTLDRYKADCNLRKMRLFQEVTYSLDGKTGGVDFSDSTLPMKSVVPDSVGEEWLEVACAVK